ncbi:MAG: hypothetical protein GDA50_04190 [Alphaproteobacteria bacterium GM202ARS2]|nr:hypothetical protein [Alphaproteobacteria bacterium GM202ARS2]
MTNTTLTADVIAKEALMILENELGVLDTFHRAHESEWTNRVNGYKIGDSLSIRRPADYTVRSGPVLATQDTIEGMVDIQINQQRGVDFRFTSTDLTLKMSDLSERVIKPAMTNLLNAVAMDCFNEFYREVYNWVGTPGQTIKNNTQFSAALQRLDELSAPGDGRCAALTPADHWAVVGSQTTLLHQQLVGSAYEKGTLGMIGDAMTYKTQVLPTHTTGAHAGTPLVMGGNQNVMYDDTESKNNWRQNLMTDGWTSNTANVVRAGDVFTIANVFQVNAKTKAKTQNLQQFTVLADASATGGAATLSISPPIITSGPHQTVDAAPADNAAITLVGSANTAYPQNLFYHKNAFALCMVPMEIPQAAYHASRQSYKNMSVRVIPIYDGTNDRSSWRLDILYGRKTIDPRIATRASGAEVS